MENHKPNMHDLCQMHSYFDQLKSKTEGAREILQEIEEKILAKLKSLTPSKSKQEI